MCKKEFQLLSRNDSQHERSIVKTVGDLSVVLYFWWSIDVSDTTNGFDPLVGHHWKLFPQVVHVYVDTAVKRGQGPTQRLLGESFSADDAACATQ